MEPIDFLSELVTNFFADEIRRLYIIQKDLTERNHSLGGHPDGFYHGGQIYYLGKPFTVLRATITAIKPSLEADAQDFALMQTKLRQDTNRLKAALVVIASRCKTLQGLRDALPESVALQCSTMQRLPRTKDEGWVLTENPMLMSQFQKVVDITLYYQANRLIY